MSVFAAICTAFSFFIIAVVVGRLAEHAVKRGDFETALKYAQHELITGLMPIGIAFFYWIFG